MSPKNSIWLCLITAHFHVVQYLSMLKIHSSRTYFILLQYFSVFIFFSVSLFLVFHIKPGELTGECEYRKYTNQVLFFSISNHKMKEMLTALDSKRDSFKIIVIMGYKIIVICYFSINIRYSSFSSEAQMVRTFNENKN